MSTGEGAISLSASNMKDMKMDYNKCTYLSWNKYFESPEIQIENGDILFVKTGSTFGKVALVEKLPLEATINPQIIVIKDIGISNKFLCYFLSTDIIRSQINCSVVGGTIPTIAQEKILNYILLIPEIQQSKQIADALDEKCGKIDKLIEKEQKQIEKMKEYKQSVITSAVTKGLNKSAPMKDSGIDWIGEIPESWEIISMKYLGCVRNGLTYNPNDLCNENEGVLVLRSSNIQEGKLVFTDNVYVNKEISDELFVKENDILICSRNGSRKLIGKNAIIQKGLDASFGAFMMIFRTNRCARYIKYILDSNIFQYYLGTFLTATINQLTADNFKNMKTPFCNIYTEQKQIVDYLDEKCGKIDEIISIKQRKIERLQEYKKSLIYEYVTGKKEVV